MVKVNGSFHRTGLKIRISHLAVQQRKITALRAVLDTEIGLEFGEANLETWRKSTNKFGSQWRKILTELGRRSNADSPLVSTGCSFLFSQIKAEEEVNKSGPQPTDPFLVAPLAVDLALALI